MGFCFTPTRMAIIEKTDNGISVRENVEKMEPFYTASVNVKWRSHFVVAAVFFSIYFY